MRASAIQKFAGKIADKRKALFGYRPDGTPHTARMASADTADTFTYYYSSGKAQERLDPSFLFKDDYDHIIRVAKTETNFRPTIGADMILVSGDPVTGADLRVTIGEIQSSQLNPEYVVGCNPPA